MSRKLDAAIAEAVGYQVMVIFDPGDPPRAEVATGELGAGEPYYLVQMRRGEGEYRPVPRFSEDGNAMLLLDAEMRQRGWVVDVEAFDTQATWRVGYMRDSDKVVLTAEGAFVISRAGSEPLARAMAAYQALTGKEWVE